MSRRRDKLPIIVDSTPPEQLPRPQRPYQAAAVSSIVQKRRLLVHAAMRCGKTRIAIDSFEAADIHRALVVCPRIVVDVWCTQVAEWARKSWRVVLLDARVKSGRAKASAIRDALQFARANPTARVLVVINYDAAWRDDVAAAIEEFDPEAIAFDESQRIKSPAGKQSLWAQRIAANARRQLVVGLTGTPMPNGPLDLYAQFRAIRPNTLGHSFVEFRNRYAVMGVKKLRIKDRRTGEIVEREVDVVVGCKNEEDLAQRIAPHTIRVTKEVLDQVPASHVRVRVDMTPAGRRVYDTLQAVLCAQYERGEINVANSLVLGLRLQQITGGSLPAVNGGAPDVVDTAKKDALSDLLDQVEADEPVVVISRFTADLDVTHRVARELERPSLELSGRRNELAAWKRGAAPILAVQIQAGGIGIDLTRARYCVFYSTSFSLGEFEQALARIHGPDQKRPVGYYYFIARDTIDEAIYGMLRKKEDNANEVVVAYLRAQTQKVNA